MQEKTLEEEFYEVFHLNNFGNLTDGKMYNKKELPEKLLAFISSREEKAREEGRKKGYDTGFEEGHKKGYAEGSNAWIKSDDRTVIRTQYKEELLAEIKKLPSCRRLSQVKELLSK